MQSSLSEDDVRSEPLSPLQIEIDGVHDARNAAVDALLCRSDPNATSIARDLSSLPSLGTQTTLTWIRTAVSASARAEMLSAGRGPVVAVDRLVAALADLFGELITWQTSTERHARSR